MNNTLELESQDEDKGSRPRSKRKSDSTQKFCEQCYRYDYHSPVKVGFAMKVTLVVLTAGLALIFWPTRCKCCGSVRF